MSETIGKKALDFFTAQRPANSRLNINFIGGEPLLEFDLIQQLTAYAREKVATADQVYFTMTSNGTLLDPEKVDFLKEEGFALDISIDGDEKTHNQHRKMKNGQGSFAKVLRSLELLQAKDYQPNLRMTVTPDQIKSLPQNVEWYVEQGMTHFNIGLDFYADWSDSWQELEDAFRQLKDYYLKTLETKRINLSIFDGKFPLFLLTGKPRYCNAGFGKFVVNLDGKIYPCVYVIDEEEFCFGDLESGVDQAKRKQTIEKYIPSYTGCDDCEISYFCHAKKCGFLNLKTTGYITHPNLTVCQHEKILYALIKEIIDELYQRDDAELLRMLEIVRQNPQLEVNPEIEKYL